MRILAYVHAYRGMGHNAGGETSLHDALRYLQSQGHDVTVLVGEQTDVPSYDFEGIPVYTSQTPGAVKQAPWDFIPGTDAIITQLTCSHRAGLMGRMFQKPVVHYVHNDHSFTARMVAQHSDAAIYNTEWVKAKFQADGIWTPGPVVHPAVEPDRYRVAKTRANRHVTLVNLSKGGDGMYDKGWQTFFELARRNPDVPFLGVRGAYGEQAHEDLPNVTYLDHTEDIREALKKTKVLLVPSKYESYGRVPVEAAASGIPAICSNTIGLHEAMGDAAAFADYGDYDTWNEYLQVLLYDGRREGDLGYGYKHFAPNKARARSEFLWDQTQAELEELGLMFQIIAAGGLREYYDYIGA